MKIAANPRAVMAALVIPVLAGCAGPQTVEGLGRTVDASIARFEEGKAVRLKLFRDRAYFLLDSYRRTLEARGSLQASARATPEQWRALIVEIEALEAPDTE